MGLLRRKLRYVLFAAGLLLAIIGSVLVYRINAKTRPFLITSSPQGVYTVYLTGQKERPLFFTVEVRFNVLKNTVPILSNRLLHSGDSEDPSFEMGYPNHRWVNEKTIQFYREEYFQRGSPDTLVVVNNTSKTIKYIKVESVDKILFFDLDQGISVQVMTPKPRGDSKWFDVTGEFSDSSQIVGANVDLTRPKDGSGPNTYYVFINPEKTTFDVRGGIH